MSRYFHSFGDFSIGVGETALEMRKVVRKLDEIGLVAIMFFFELLFSYVSSSISFYVSLTKLFSIILFLIC